jgi:hypothetical protein
MSEQPEPTRPIDMAELLADTEDEEAPEAPDAVKGEPGWEGDTPPAQAP